jgi:hypothetical protein
MAEEAVPQGQVSGARGDGRGGRATRPGECRKWQRRLCHKAR